MAHSSSAAATLSTMGRINGSLISNFSASLSAFAASMSMGRRRKTGSPGVASTNTRQTVFGFTTAVKGYREPAFVDEFVFNITVCFFIILNCIIMGFEADLKRKDKDNPVWIIFENVFCTVWVVEAACKVFYDRVRYFYNPWNNLDLALAILSVLEAWVMPCVNIFMDAGADDDDTLLSKLELFRIARLLRLVKLMRMFNELWIIVIGFLQALSTFVWVLLLLALVIYACAIYLTIVVGYTCDSDFAWWDECEDFFGNVWLSMYTLFQVMTLESWSSAVARKLLRVHPFMFIFFVVFLLTTTFGLLNIIVGVIVENTLLANNKARRDMARAREESMRKELDSLRGLFSEFDEDGSGHVDEEEFEAIFKKEELVKKMEEMNIHVTHPDYIFSFIDKDDSGSISVDEFIDGLMAYKSLPTHQEVHVLLMQIRVAERQVMNLSNMLMGNAIQSDPSEIEASVERQMSPDSSPSTNGSPNNKKSRGRNIRVKSGSPKNKSPNGRRKMSLDFHLVREYSEATCECPRTLKMPLGATFCCFCGHRLQDDDAGNSRSQNLSPRSSDCLQEANHWAPLRTQELMPSKGNRSHRCHSPDNSFRDIAERLDEVAVGTCRRLQALEEVMESLAKSQNQILVDFHKALHGPPTRTVRSGATNGFGYEGIGTFGDGISHEDDGSIMPRSDSRVAD